MHPFQEAIARAARRHRLFAGGGESVVVAVSGGVDSMALLHALNALQRRLNIMLIAATFDHQLRGEASAADAQFVVETATAWGIPAYAGADDVAAHALQRRMNVEAAGRELRYAFLVRTAKTAGATTIVTAHHADDQAETVLMHLLRGAGVEGMGGMGYVAPVPNAPNLRLVRPLLEVERQEVEAYCRDFAIPFRHDATNDDTAYTRNRLRHEVLPFLEAHSPGTKRALVRLGDIAAHEDEVVRAALLPLIEQSVIVEGRVDVAQTVYQMAPTALRRRWLRWAGEQLSLESQTLDYTSIVEADDVLMRVEGGLRASFGDEAWAFRENGKIIVQRV